MEIKKFNSASEFARYIEAYYTETKHTWQYDVSIIAPFEQARDIATELIAREFGLEFIENFSNGLIDDYIGDYEINICNNNISITKALDESTGEYNDIDSIICYVSDKCNSKVLKSVYSEDVYELHIGNEEELSNQCDGDCGDCSCHTSVKVNGKEVVDEAERRAIIDEYIDDLLRPIWFDLMF